MKLKEILLAILIAAGSLRAQVGIGTKTPESKLDVKGDIKIGNEGKTDAQGKKGMMRWSDANNCMESHNGAKWRCISKEFSDFREPLVRLRGGEFITYSDGKGWKDNNFDCTPENTLKLNVTGGNNQGVYKDGIITAPEDGVYEVIYRVSLVIRKVKGNFDGDGGNFYAWIAKNNSIHGPRSQSLVLRGAAPGDKIALYSHRDTQILHLKKGDKISVHFGTFNAVNMNDDTNDILIDKSHSDISFWKLN